MQLRSSLHYCLRGIQYAYISLLTHTKQLLLVTFCYKTPGSGVRFWTHGRRTEHGRMDRQTWKSKQLFKFETLALIQFIPTIRNYEPVLRNPCVRSCVFHFARIFDLQKIRVKWKLSVPILVIQESKSIQSNFTGNG